MNPNARIRLLGADFDLSYRLGGAAPSQSAGGARWNEAQRPEARGLTVYEGEELERWDVPVLLDGHAEDRDVGPELDSIRALARGDGDEQPADFVATGPFPFSGLRCVMERPEVPAEGSIRTAAGVLTRQPLTLRLVEFNDPAALTLVRNPTATTSKKKQKRVVVAKAGDTLLKLAQRHLGSAARAKELGKLNGIRDVRKKLKAGTKIRLPAKKKG